MFDTSGNRRADSPLTRRARASLVRPDQRRAVSGERLKRDSEEEYARIHLHGADSLEHGGSPRMRARKSLTVAGEERSDV
ncbi:hypothetical protein GCM10010421_29170 [Streptomyces glaucus]|uniref:Uncharacterized protein n=1 Tax=Streptomyces glaucus TaxID=284029 RepID=A0ABN3JQD4_9ACTN